jgi:hypothetical protein
LASVGSETRIAPSTPECTPPRHGVSVDAAWELTRAISPRKTVRVAAVDAYGAALNLYSRARRVDAARPDAPWALNLADADGNYLLIGFDLDAKTHSAAEDADGLSAMLTRHGIEHVVCRSGPTDGRHVWLALSAPVDARTISDLAYVARHVFPSLDIAPLTNPQTGCLRPPGAPHRFGGASSVLSGDLRTLRSRSTRPESISALLAALSALVGDAEHLRRHDTGSTHVDEHGRPYIPGAKRPLPSFSARAAAEPAALGDASTVLWRVLIGAAAAHWHYDDVASLAETAPGLEHVRTLRDRSNRTARPVRGPASPAAVLARQWHKAVQHVASRDKRTGDDPTFDGRANGIANHVQQIQERARASAGRWLHGGGPADRRVLDALCLLALKSLSATVEADIRRLALIAGTGRETARTALLRLAADGWIAQVRAAEGPHGAHWSLASRADIHRNLGDSRSQADPRPPGAGAAKRTGLLLNLSTRLTDATHDVFTLSPGLGHHAGNVFAHTTTLPLSTSQIADSLGIAGDHVVLTLGRLVRYGLLVQLEDGWKRPDIDPRPAVARQLSVDGRLKARAARYEFERELWAWWQAEQAWMHAPRRSDASRRPRPGQVSLVPITETNVFGAHPRRSDGRADYRRARALLAEGDGIVARPVQPATRSATRRGRRAA